MKIDFIGKSVFLTGGSRGIGKAIKEMFCQSGATVISPERSRLDLSKTGSIEKYLQEEDLQIDIFVHCAGVNELAGIQNINLDIINRVFQVNYNAPVILMSRFAEHMKEQKWGRVIFISSLYAIVSREERIAYSSSKNALTGLMKTLALELAPQNILVNAVAPGYVMTDMTKQNLSKQEIANIENNIPTGRFQTEDEIANMVAFLCSKLNNSVTGQLIAVDGGYTCR